MKRNNRPEGLRHFLTCMRDREVQCTSVLKPIDMRNFHPVAVKVKKNTFESLLCEYFRLMISSEPQKAIAKGTSRSMQWLFFDKVSGGLLGFSYMCDMNLPWGLFDDWVGAPIGGIGGPFKGRHARDTAMHVQQLRRCLPIFEFGQMTGGKMMALAMVSTEVVEISELTYSFDIMVMLIKALHGRTSQYNRLHPRGIIQNPQLSAPDKACYSILLRENALPFLRKETTDPGKRLTYSYQKQIEYWKERWLPNRMDRTDNGIIRPDVSRYLLSPTFDERLAKYTKAVEEIAINGEDDAG